VNIRLFQPPPTYLKLSLFGEIVSGKNFEYDDLYVYYCLDLPDGKASSSLSDSQRQELTSVDLDWYAEASMIVSGYTHTASATETSKNVRICVRLGCSSETVEYSYLEVMDEVKSISYCFQIHLT
jgi:hypothetical protein